MLRNILFKRLYNVSKTINKHFKIIVENVNKISYLKPQLNITVNVKKYII